MLLAEVDLLVVTACLENIDLSSIVSEPSPTVSTLALGDLLISNHNTLSR